MRRTALATLILLAVATDARPRPKSEACFRVHGRLFAANGNPTFRIAPAGTRRILGVHQSDDGADVLPPSVRRLVEPDAFRVDVLGDFQVCPLAPDRPGRMRPVRLEAGRNLWVRAH
jgi:hypothetical protein